MKLNLLNKKVKYINFRTLFKKIYKKEFTTAELKRKFLPKSQIRLHNSLNDCFVLLNVFKEIKSKYEREKFFRIISKNIKVIKI